MNIPVKLLLRDLLLIAVTVLLLDYSHSLDAIASAGRIPVAIAAGLMLPLSGFLIHEWGHLIGALLKSAAVELPRKITAIFLFRFDSGLNTPAQFMAMWWGGFVASVLVVIVYALTLSVSHLADIIALSLTIIGVIATFVLEVPEALAVRRTGELPRGAAFVDGRQPRA